MVLALKSDPPNYPSREEPYPRLLSLGGNLYSVPSQRLLVRGGGVNGVSTGCQRAPRQARPRRLIPLVRTISGTLEV